MKAFGATLFDPKFETSQPSDYLCIVIQNVLCFENVLHIIRKTSLKIPLINVASVQRTAVALASNKHKINHVR